MDQGRGLVRLAGLLPGEALSGQLAQLVVHQRRSCSAAWGSPCSMAERMHVTSFIATVAVGRRRRVPDPSPGDVARPITSGPVSERGRLESMISPGRRRGQPGSSPRWRRGRLGELAGGKMGIVYNAR
jgi:hypothetical protein